MRQYLLILVFVCGAPASLWAQTVPDSLRDRLAASKGTDRIEVLAALLDATYRNTPEEAIDYGREALDLLASHPDAALEEQILFRKAQAHDNLAQWDSVLVLAERLSAMGAESAKAQADADLLTGMAEFHRSAYDAAIASLEAALAGYEQVGEQAGIARTLNTLGLVHRLQSNYGKALPFFQRAMALSEELGDKQELASSFHQIGILHRLRNEDNEALTFLNRALALREEIGDKRGMAASLNSLGILHNIFGNYDEALACHTRSQALWEELGDKDRIATSLFNIGVVHRNQGTYDEALSFFTRALALYEEVGNRRGMATSLDAIGSIYTRLGNYHEALTFQQRGLAIREELGNQRMLALSILGIGEIYHSLGDGDKARDYYMRALRIDEENGIRIDQATALNKLGVLHRERGDYEKALDFFTGALVLQKEFENPLGQANVLTSLSVLYGEQGDLDEALAANDRALTLADSIGALPLVHTAYGQRADLLKSLGRFEEALAAREAYLVMHDSLFNSESQGVIAELQEQYRTKDQQQQIALLESNRRQQRLWVTLLLGGVGVLVIIVAMQVGRMRLRRQALAAIEEARRATEEKADELQQKTVELQHKTDELERANELKSRFLANISHEFRTPLTLTFGPLEDAIEGRFGSFSEARPHFERARRNGGRLLRLINQLLDLSKLDAGALLLRPHEHNLAAHLRHLAALFDSMAQNRQITFTTHLPAEPVPHVYDADKIEKVVINLLSNAFKFTGPGGKISLSLAEETGGMVRIEVADTGPGIAEEHMPHLFDRFYQVESTSTRTHEGTGIGLALVKELVALHEGEIAVESKFGFGTTFTVRLPMLEAVAVEVPDSTNGATTESITVVAGAVEDISSLLARPVVEPGELPSIYDDEGAPEAETVVLVVEDNADMRAYIRSHLEDLVTVVEAENGRIGLEQALEVVPDLVLSDVMMPEMDGLELCQALRADERTSHIPVVLLTARAQVEDRIAGFTSGADAYLPKPFNAEELQVRVKTLIEERRRLRSLYRGAAPHERPAEDIVLGTLPPSEAAFLQKLYAHIEESYSDPQFGAESFAEGLHMSLRQLHRKLGALTDETPAALIRRLRMERAAALLALGEMAVKEVAYSVGYRSNSNFSRLFQKTYGVSPSEYGGLSSSPVQGTPQE